MSSDVPVTYVARPDGLRLACRFLPGDGPLRVFLPGYASDMEGGKAQAVLADACDRGKACLLLDYAGCGGSDGAFEDGTLSSWREDARFLIDQHWPGELMLIGSSMGGWIALLLGQAMGGRTAGLIGIAAAPDFTDWGFDDAQKATLAKAGQLEQANPYGDQPTVTTGAFWQSGQRNLLLGGSIDIMAPVRLIQGQNDADVPWQTALRITHALRSDDVQLCLVKDGDHRLSREQDIALLLATLHALETA